MASAAPLRICRPSQFDAADARLRREGNERRPELLHVAAAQAILALWPAPRCCGPRAFRRPARQAGPRRPESGRSTPSAGRNSTAWRLPSVIVPVLSSSSTSTSPAASTARPRRGDHVGLDHAIHAGDADGRQQAADGGGNQADQQRHEHRDGDRRALAGGARRCNSENGSSVTQTSRKMIVMRRQQDVERDFVGGLLPLGAFDHRDHAVEERFAGIGGDAHDQPVGQHARAAGDAAAVAAAFADHRCALAGDGAFVDRGDAFDHLAVGGDLSPASTSTTSPLRRSSAETDVDCARLAIAARAASWP